MTSPRLVLVTFCALFVCVYAQVDPSQPYTFTSYANNENSFGSPSSSTARGQAVVQLDETNGILRASVVHTVSGAVAMHFHGPALPGASASPIFFFADGNSPNYGSWNVTATQATDLLAGKYYWNIHSMAYPNGEIRGQVLAIGQSEVFLGPAFEVPPVGDNEGVGWALVAFNSATNVTTAYVNSNATLSNITAAFIAGPANYTSTAQKLLGLSTASFPLTGSGTITSDYVYSDSLYLSLASSTDPNGFARGQLSAPTNYASEMVNSSTTSLLGVCLIAAYPQQGYVSIVHNIINPTSLTIYGGAIPLPSYSSPIQFPISPGASLTMLLQYLPTGLITFALSNGTHGVQGLAKPVTTPAPVTSTSTSTSTATILSTTTSTAATTSSTSSTGLISSSSTTSSSTASTVATASATSTASASSTASTSTVTTSGGNVLKLGAFGLLASVSALMI